MAHAYLLLFKSRFATSLWPKQSSINTTAQTNVNVAATFISLQKFEPDIYHGSEMSRLLTDVEAILN